MKKISVWAVAGLLVLGANSGFGQTAATPQAPPPASATPPTAPAPIPALWRVKGVHGSLYLFGSFHVMKKDVPWETDKVKAALSASDTLYLEIAGVDQAAATAAQPQILQLGTDPEHALSTKISKADVDLLDAAAKSMGLPGEQAMEPMQPWLVWATLTVLPAMKAGYDPQSGIDHSLEVEAKETKKPVKGLETMDEQLHMLADMPMPMQVEMLHQALVDLPKNVTELDAMMADWTRGDVEAIGKEDNDEMKTKYPELYDKLLVKRNVRFTDELAGMLKDPAAGTTFVAIGAAHFAGPDSVIKMLEGRGYKVERVE